MLYPDSLHQGTPHSSSSPTPAQARQQESRVQSRELREKRQAFLEAERRRKEEEAARRMQEVGRGRGEGPEKYG